MDRVDLIGPVNEYYYETSNVTFIPIQPRLLNKMYNFNFPLKPDNLVRLIIYVGLR